MVEFGAGMLVFAPLRLAVLESFLPNGSSQLGPPLCIILLVTQTSSCIYMIYAILCMEIRLPVYFLSR